MSNPAYSKIRPDSKLEYSWKDIQEAQRTGFEDCKKKILDILQKNKNSLYYTEYFWLSGVVDKINKL